MTRKQRRLALVAACLAGLGAATALTLTAFQDNLVFFIPPSEIAAKAVPGRSFRLGGLVEAGSLTKSNREGKPLAQFRVTDGAAFVTVEYIGILPDLFREGQGVVALGMIKPDGGFVASEVLAKHDETYMPREVADSLKKAGHWNPEKSSPPPAAAWNAGSAKKGGS
jgi:cytochrome c-type biogenesis protein CcmE